MTVTMPDPAPDDPHRDLFGGTNGRGGSFMTSTEQHQARQIRQNEAIAKAANPADLTVEDLAALPDEMIGELMRTGQVAHLTFGGRRSGPRPRMRRG